MVFINTALQNATSAYQRQHQTPAETIHIVLTGGLSCNSYIKDAIAARIKEQYRGSVNVIVPDKNEG